MEGIAPGAAQSVLGKLKRVDLFPKTLDDFRVKTTSGAAISIVSVFFLVVLFFSELAIFISTDIRHEMVVDTANAMKELRINIDITFERMPCSYLSLDAMDISGSNQLDVLLNIYKKRMSPEGDSIEETPEKETVLGGPEIIERPANYCGSCYGAEDEPGECCNTCDQVREAYRKKGWGFANGDNIEQCAKEGFTDKLQDQKGEGCHIYGHLEVSRVAGNFHFAPGKSFQQNHMHVHDLLPFQMADFNMTHRINKLSFGEDFPGVVNPMDGVGKISTKAAPTMYQYFVKVVPTDYVHSNGLKVESNQYSFTEHKRDIVPGHGSGLPGVFMMYDISPIRVKITESRRSFLHFLTNVCAIVGGVFTVSGIIDSLVYHSMRSIKKKMELGKAW